MGGAAAAAQLLATAVQRQQRILIIGDFDCDGATSTALSLLALRALGAENVDYLLPDRFLFGYGLTPEIVAEAAKRKPQLIVTVDNGISSVEGVAAANELGIPVLITDHHLPGARLPDAAAMVNPNLPDNPFPAKSTAGVGVIFYVLLALRARLRELGWFETRTEPNMANYLDLVALGTVADVVPLQHNNRILVHQGLMRIRARRCRPGILALLEVAKRPAQQVQSMDLGFCVGPRLNAAGRLQNMSIGVECLLADDAQRARELAHELDRLNRQRRVIEDDMRQQARQWLDAQQQNDAELPWGLCLYDASWHQGVIGILASRIKDHHHRPVIAFAPGDDGELKGSGRSIAGLHLRDVLAEIASDRPDLLHRFGGHAMAAGLTLARDRFEEFSRHFDAVVRQHLSEDQLQAVVWSDGELNQQELDMQLAEILRTGGPWGQEFPEPVFHGRFQVINQRLLQDKHWKLVLQCADGEPWLDAIGFNLAQHFPDSVPANVTLAYQLDVNEYRGNRSLQLRISHMEEA